MDVKDLVKEKIKLEEDILSLLKEFSLKTNIELQDITINFERKFYNLSAPGTFPSNASFVYNEIDVEIII